MSLILLSLNVLVEDHFLQSGARRVATLLQITQVGVLLLSFAFFGHSIRAQVFACCRLNVPHQLCITPV